MNSTRERPILFSGPMVRALLDGTKTQTRRIVKPQPVFNPAWGSAVGKPGAWLYRADEAKTRDRWGVEMTPAAIALMATAEAYGWGVGAGCPYGVPGDRLWVRETMRLRDAGKRSEAWTYAVDGAEVALPKGDPRIGAMLAWAHHKEGNTCVSIHMPRWASRITLEVTAVRVERLQDITEEDARAEGVEPDVIAPGTGEEATRRANERYRRGFANLWDNGEKALWFSNPWVWVVSFRRVRHA